ncbi:MAG: helix-turn-helix transcriptional regulator, partial [Clostridiales bacterium]|nr:helix-turn-helix transcriptional regulator [Clostridiales bacterium]MDY5513330.1 helix-turn-helix transcriptional regulator [Candidatus Ventricola sp.]
MDAEKTGAMIRALRMEQGLTQAALAERLHVTDKAVSKWERGQGCPDLPMLPALADVFQVSVESIL